MIAATLMSKHVAKGVRRHFNTAATQWSGVTVMTDMVINTGFNLPVSLVQGQPGL